MINPIEDMTNVEARALELTTSIQQFVNNKGISKRIILGTLASKRIYCILNRKVANKRAYCSVSFAINYEKNSPQSGEFFTIKLATMQSQLVVNELYKHLGAERFSEIEVDVYKAANKRSARPKADYNHLQKPKTESDIRLAKLERKMFNNPKLWKFTDPNQ